MRLIEVFLKTTDYEQKLHYDEYGLAFSSEDVVQSRHPEKELIVTTGIANRLYWIDENKTEWIDRSGGPFVPTWQVC